MIRKILFIILLGTFFWSQGKVDGVVAVVGKNIILHSDVLQQSRLIAINKKIDHTKNPYLFESIYQETLTSFINQYIILDVAEKDTNIIISGEDIDRALEQKIDDFIQQAGSKESFEKMVGSPLRKIKSDYWTEIKNMMYIDQYKGMKIQPINISRVEVLNFYEQYKDSIPPVPETYNYSVIEVPVVAGELSELKTLHFLDSIKILILNNSVSFDSLAKKYSQDPGSASSGGKLGYTSRGSLVQPYEEAAYSLSVGEISSPIRSEFGYHLIKLINKKGERISTQHILKIISKTEEDYVQSLEKINHIYNLTKNDPFVFDSLAILSKNQHKNYSGTFVNITSDQIHYDILKELKKIDVKTISKPINTDNGVALIFLYNHEQSYNPTPNNSWSMLYEYALRNKQNKVFNQIIEKLKKRTYVKILYN